MQAFVALGYQPISLCGQGDVMYDPIRQCDISFMKLGDCSDSYVELIAPKTKESPIYGLMNTYKNSPYHLCFESEDLNGEVELLQSAGWMVFQPATPAPAINGNHVVFLIHRSAGIIELVEKNCE